MMEQKEQISWSLLMKKIRGEELTAAEEERFRHWMADPRCEAYFRRASAAWNEEEETSPTEVSEMIRRFDSYVAQQPSAQPKRAWRRYAAYAAVALLPLFIIGGVYYFNKKSETVQPTAIVSQPIPPGRSQARIILDDGEERVLGDAADSLWLDEDGVRIRQQQGTVSYLSSSAAQGAEEKRNTLVVPRGGEYHIVLSDGTRVWINSASSLKYPVQFVKAERIVELEGEAYFEVAKNASSPFIVKTAGQQVQVYGTSFNIEAYPSEQRQYVTLAEGSIGVRRGGQEYRLVPGQQARTTAGTDQVEVVKVDAARYCGWHMGQLSLENERLEDILTKLSRWYDVDFAYADASLKELHFTGDLERYANFTDLLNLIKMTTRVDFVIEGRQVKVIPKE